MDTFDLSAKYVGLIHSETPVAVAYSMVVNVENTAAHWRSSECLGERYNAAQHNVTEEEMSAGQ